MFFGFFDKVSVRRERFIFLLVGGIGSCYFYSDGCCGLERRNRKEGSGF